MAVAVSQMEQIQQRKRVPPHGCNHNNSIQFITYLQSISLAPTHMSSFGTAPNAMRNRSKILSDKDQDLLGICSCSQCSYVKILAGSMYHHVSVSMYKDLCGFTLPELDRHQFLFRANSCAVRGGLPALDTAA